MKAAILLVLITSLSAQTFLSDSLDMAYPNSVQNEELNQKKLIASLKQEASQIVHGAAPLDYQKTIAGITAFSDFKMDSLYKSDIKALHSRYKIPLELIPKLEPILFGADLRISVERFTYVESGTMLDEYIFAAYGEGEYFRFAFVKVLITGTIKPEYDNYLSTTKETIFGIPSHTEVRLTSLVKGINLKDLEIMKKTLRAFGWQQMQAKLNMQDDDIQFSLSQDSPLYSISNKYKALIHLKTGQLFVGDATYNPEGGLSVPASKGHLIGPPTASYRNLFSFQVKNSGKVQIVTSDKRALWETNITPKEERINIENPPLKVVVTEDPRLLVVNKYWKPIWDSKDGKIDNTLPQIKELYLCLEQDYRYSSDNGEYYATVKSDGEFILVQILDNTLQETIKVIWRSGYFSNVPGPHRVIIDRNGVMQGRGKDMAFSWRTHNNDKGYPPFKLEITDDGAMNIVDGRNKVIWTAGLNNNLNMSNRTYG